MMEVTQWEADVKAMVGKYARSCSPDVKDDLKQDCFLILLRRESNITNVLESGGLEEATKYVRTICKNEIIHKLTSLSENAGVELVSPTHDEVAKAPNYELANGLDKLPQDQRYIVDCYFYRGMTEEEIANTVGKSRRWVNNEKDKAVKALRNIMETK